MKEFHLNYYPNFKCIANNCTHSCCVGWVMKIDQDSLNNYKTHNSAFSPRLKKGINFKKSMFKRDKKGRCAFLNDKGLCDIIINLGENSLCQVCADHPRFRTFFDDRVEMGLGFSCEQATRIILGYKDKIEPIIFKDDLAQISPSPLQAFVLEFRQKALAIIQDRNTPISNRLQALLSLSNAQISAQDFNKVLKTFLSLERLDKHWTKRLLSLKKNMPSLTTENSLELYCEQFLVNGIFRHVSSAEDSMTARARMVSCVLSWWVIKEVFELEKTDCDFDLICDVVREFSAEVEYSENNLTKLFNHALKFVKI